MKIIVNGVQTEYSENSLSVLDIIVKNKVESPEMVSVQLNGEYIERDVYEKTYLKEGDEIDFLYFMGGGAL